MNERGLHNMLTWFIAIGLSARSLTFAPSLSAVKQHYGQLTCEDCVAVSARGCGGLLSNNRPSRPASGPSQWAGPGSASWHNLPVPGVATRVLPRDSAVLFSSDFSLVATTLLGRPAAHRPHIPSVRRHELCFNVWFILRPHRWCF